MRVLALVHFLRDTAVVRMFENFHLSLIPYDRIKSFSSESVLVRIHRKSFYATLQVVLEI